MKTFFYLLILLLVSFTNYYAQSEKEILLNLFNYSADMTETSSNLVSLSIDAVWLASEIVGTATITGTLTQDVNNYWTYSSSPSDKLVLTYSDGSSLEFNFAVITGYDEGEVDDFKNSHTMDFTCYIKDYLSLRIESTANPTSEKTYYINKVTGSIVNNDEVNQVNYEHTFDKAYIVDYGYAQGIFDDLVTGSVTTPTMTIELADRFHIELANNSDAGQYVKSSQRWSNSSVAFTDNAYAYNGLNVFWVVGTQFADDADAGIYNSVVDAHQWFAQGEVLKNSQNYGAIEFSGEVVDYTTGPYLRAQLNNGEEVVLHPLLNPVVDVKESIEKLLPNKFILEQNYPNPFNPATVISFSIPKSGFVELNVYNTLGEMVAELIHKNMEVGNYQINFDASKLTSGIYFYSISVNGFTQVKKMNLIK